MTDKLFVDSIYEKFGCTKIKDTRKRDVLIIRQAMSVYLYDTAELPYDKIAKMLNITHATVLNAVKRYWEYRQNYMHYKVKTNEIIDYCHEMYCYYYNKRDIRIRNIKHDLEQRIIGMRIAGVNADIFNERLLKLKQNER